MKTTTSFLATCTFLLLSSVTHATPVSLAYQGRILKSDGSPLEYNSVSFIFQILDPTGLCLIYKEQVDGIDMLNSNGLFDVSIGAGTVNYPPPGPLAFKDVFNNSGVFTCSDGSTYTASASDARKLRVQFHDGISWRTISPDSTIQSVPFALQADMAAKLGDKVAGDFVLKTSIPTCAVNTSLTFDGTSFTCQPSGAGGITGVTSTNAYMSIANGTTAPQLTLNIGSAANTLAAGDDPRFSNSRTPNGAAGGDLAGTFPSPSVAKIQGVDIDTTAPTSGYVLKFNGTKWAPAADSTGAGTITGVTAGTGLTGGGSSGAVTLNVAVGTSANQIVQLDASAKLPAIDGSALTNLNANNLASGTVPAGRFPAFSGDVTSSAGATVLTIANLAVTDAKINDVGVDKITSGSAKYFTYKPNNTACTNGQVLSWNNSNSWWECASTATGTVTSISAGAGLTGGTITGTGTIGLGTELTGVSGLSTLGYIQRTGAGTYSTTVGNTANSNSTVVLRDGSGVSGFSGVALTNGTTNVTHAAATAGSSYTLTWPANPASANGQVLASTTTGTLSWVSAMTNSLASGQMWMGDGSNIATAVTMSGDATISSAGVLTIENNAITNAKISASAAIARSKIATDTANAVLINDSSGNLSSEAQLSISRGGTGTSSVTANRLIASNGTGSALTTFTCAVGQYLSFDASGMMICSNNPATNNFTNGGNSFGAAATIGTNDSYALNIETNNSTRMTIDASGNVGIGTPSPRAGLDVNNTVLLKPSVVNGTATVDFATGNLQHTTNNCGAFNLHNMKDGGAYTFAVKGATSTTCSFNAYSDAGVTAITVHLPTDHGATTASKHTLYSFVVMGSDVYVSWMPGI